jgi:hypothetical protein
MQSEAWRHRTVTQDGIKRSISFAVFGLGILGGLWGWLAYLGAMFVVGENDCSQEVWAITFALATPLPACIVALWWRKFAGLWLIFAGCYFPYGMVVQRAYMIQVRHFPNQPTILRTVEQNLIFALPLIAVGLFAVITGLLKWPKLIQWPADQKSQPADA